MDAVAAATIPESFTNNVIRHPTIDAINPLNIIGYLLDIFFICFEGLNINIPITAIPTNNIFTHTDDLASFKFIDIFLPNVLNIACGHSCIICCVNTPK